ncbi:hypothetical protein B0H10DRAFT_1941282 [Mycena sp. CBHHK59/15]|nr:hypothetical protein B0H10DRAFT_1941282 [Mycena sp. CBHHK59/15]
MASTCLDPACIHRMLTPTMHLLLAVSQFNTNSCIPPIETHTCAPPPKGARGRALVAQVTVEACGACHACAKAHHECELPVGQCGLIGGKTRGYAYPQIWVPAVMGRPRIRV